MSEVEAKVEELMDLAADAYSYDEWALNPVEQHEYLEAAGERFRVALTDLVTKAAENARLRAENERMRLIMDGELPSGSCGLALESGFWESQELTDAKSAAIRLRAALEAAEGDAAMGWSFADHSLLCTADPCTCGYDAAHAQRTEGQRERP